MANNHRKPFQLRFMSESVFSNQGLYSGNNFPNALDFIVRSIVRQMINTALPVMVETVFPGDENAAGYVQCLPLVMPRDPKGNSIQTVSIPKLPFYRLYAGRAAIICDPVPGDVGLAVFAQQDSSRVKKGTSEPQSAGSFRCFDMSDGFYLGGFYNGNGDTNIIFDQQGNITINAPTAQTINTETATVNSKTSTINAEQKVTVNSPLSEFTGDVTIQKALTVLGGAAISGGSGASVEGNMAITNGDVTADAISLKQHTHTCPDGKTGPAE